MAYARLALHRLAQTAEASDTSELSAEELATYKDAGHVVLRGPVPECLADVLREQVI